MDEDRQPPGKVPSIIVIIRGVAHLDFRTDWERTSKPEVPTAP